MKGLMVCSGRNQCARHEPRQRRFAFRCKPTGNNIANRWTAHYRSASRGGGLCNDFIKPDGSAGAITTLQLSGDIAGPDGMRVGPGEVLLFTENRINKLTEAKIDGDKATLRVIKDGFTQQPTAIAVVGDTAWGRRSQAPAARGPEQGPRSAADCARRAALTAFSNRVYATSGSPQARLAAISAASVNPH
jgi:hypothetical protein